MCCLRAPKVGGSFSLSAMHLQNRCQHNSGMLESWMPFGRYAVQTNLAKVNCKSSLISTSSQSVHRALNSKRIPVALNGDGPMLSFDFAWEKVVVDSCLASCRMELALEILCEA